MLRGPKTASITPASGLRRIEVQANAVHLCLDRARLIHSYDQDEVALARLQGKLVDGDRIVLDNADPGLIRLVLPVRLQARGGRNWIVAPNERPALSKFKKDRALITALHSSHDVLAAMGWGQAGDGLQNAVQPSSAYQRLLCPLALLAPDIQKAILEGPPPPGLTLDHLIHADIPVAWVDQRAAFGF